MYKMCIHRSSNCSSCKFSTEIEESLLVDKRSSVYKMCKHRGSNCSSCKIFIEVVVN